MATFRSLKTLINKNRNEKIRTFLTAATTSLIPSPYAPPSLHPLDFPPPHRFLSPLSKWVAAAPHFHGPLFLSSPPWNLSQSSVPRHFRGGSFLALRKVDALSLDLLRSRVGSRLLLGQGREVDRLEEVEEDGAVRNGLMESFVNLPNLISIARLLSGPLLGWYGFSL
uniref:Uncharacterized protein n=1 Tax=Rhizophora mucronata TaxID=61149 RepID=A0A2P2JUU4_RHIMU